MKRSLLTVFLVIVFVLLTGVQGFAQTYQEKREALLNRQENARAEINLLEARIKNYQERINQAEKRYDKSFEQFQSLNNLIALQDDKIKTLQREQEQIQAEIELTEQEIEVRETELNQLLENYKKIVLYAYKNGRAGNLELLLTSNSINQMLVRSKYLQKFEEQKGKQARLIRESREELAQVKKDLENSYEKNRVVLGEIREEKSELGEQRQKQQQTVEQIKEERSTWLAELRKTREEKENLENTFSNLIEEEERLREAENERLRRLEEARKIADVNRRADEVEKYSRSAYRENFVSDEELLAYENSFEQAKGQLPWPVNSRTISKKFGRVRNPIYGTETEHPGIDIVTDPKSEVSVVSDGYVYAVQPLPGYGDVVFVKHGSYYTAYGNLSQIDVRIGTVLKKGDRVGLSGTEQTEMGEVLFFLLREGNSFVNPVPWLSSK